MWPEKVPERSSSHETWAPMGSQQQVMYIHQGQWEYPYNIMQSTRPCLRIALYSLIKTAAVFIKADSPGTMLMSKYSIL